MTFTVIGADGFIGSALLAHLRGVGADVRAVGRSDDIVDPEHVIDCAGVTADFRTRPLDAMEAHAGRVARLLRDVKPRTYLYVSSTRVYQRCATASEDTPIIVCPSDLDDLYAISKVAGEASCLSVDDPGFRVVRVSNVVGDDSSAETFLSSVVRDAVTNGHVALGIHPDSHRDFIRLDDVVTMLPRIADCGRSRIYNLASGRNTTAGELVQRVCEATGATAAISDRGECISFPTIDVNRIRRELGFEPADPFAMLPELIRSARAHQRTR